MGNEGQSGRWPGERRPGDQGAAPPAGRGCRGRFRRKPPSGGTVQTSGTHRGSREAVWLVTWDSLRREHMVERAQPTARSPGSVSPTSPSASLAICPVTTPGTGRVSFRITASPSNSPPWSAGFPAEFRGGALRSVPWDRPGHTGHSQCARVNTSFGTPSTPSAPRAQRCPGPSHAWVSPAWGGGGTLLPTYRPRTEPEGFRGSSCFPPSGAMGPEPCPRGV